MYCFVSLCQFLIHPRFLLLLQLLFLLPCSFLPLVLASSRTVLSFCCLAVSVSLSLCGAKTRSTHVPVGRWLLSEKKREEGHPDHSPGERVESKPVNRIGFEASGHNDTVRRNPTRSDGGSKHSRLHPHFGG